MSTARDLIKRSLRIINVLASGETATGAEMQDGLDTLNSMLSSWQLENLNIFATKDDSLVLTASDGSYTIGSGGDINTDRPNNIKTAFLRQNDVDYDLEIIGEGAYNEIPDKTVTGLPYLIYYNATSTLGVLKLFPVPDDSYTLHIIQTEHLQTFSNLSTVVVLPSGYDDAIAYSLAMRLAPEYGFAVTQELLMMSNETKKAIKQANIKPIIAKMETGFISNSRGDRFNINRGY